MAWLLGGSSVPAPLQRFESLLEQATSELQPTPTISAGTAPETLQFGLDMADLIRSGQVKPSEAVKGLRRRLAHENPNVQLYTLMTLDVAIKNAGDGFLKEVANGGTAGGALPGVGARGLVEELGEMARSSGNSDVKSLALRHLQNWATAFESKSNLAISELVLMYRRLKHEGQPFPPRDPSATAAMIDSMAAPEWTESDVCSRCREQFTVLNRRHHCRACGNIFDHKCSSKTMALPQFGITDEVRVCDGCYKKLRSGRRATMVPQASPRPSYESSSHRYSMSSSLPATSSMRGPSSRSQEDADLQRALELSLAESRAQLGGQRSSSPAFERRTHVNGKGVEAEDPELAAAIEASLREMQVAQPVLSSSSAAPPSSLPSVPQPYELATRDLDSLLSFAQTVGNSRASNRPPQLHELTPAFERAMAARPNMVRAVQDASKRQQLLTEMGDKLTHAVRLYDHLLEQQVARHSMPAQHYAPSYAAPYAPAPAPPRPQYAPAESAAPARSMYPALPPQEPARYVTSPAPHEPYHADPRYAQPSQPPSAQPSWHAAPTPPQHAPPPDVQPRYQSPERQFQPYASYGAPSAPPSMGPSAPMASPSRETAGFVASAPLESPALSHASVQPSFGEAGAWQGPAAPEPSTGHYAPPQAHPHPQPGASALAPSAPVAPVGRVYNETSFPTAPSANPWDEEPPELEQPRRAEAPLIEF